MKILIIACLFFSSLLLKAQEYKVSLGLGVPILSSNVEFANQNTRLLNIQTNLNVEYSFIYCGIGFGFALFSSNGNQKEKTTINRPTFEGGCIIDWGKYQIRPAIQLGYSFIRVTNNLFGELLVSEKGVFLAPKLSIKRKVSNKIDIAAYSIFNIDFTNMPYLTFKPVKQRYYTLMYLFGISVGYKIK